MRYANVNKLLTHCFKFIRVFCYSPSDKISEEAASEFWNRDDEASGSEEDISDYDGISFNFNFNLFAVSFFCGHFSLFLFFFKIFFFFLPRISFIFA